jgi:hypothetical protein
VSRSGSGTGDADEVPSAPAWAIGATFLVAGAIVLVIGRLVGPSSRAPLFWGLLLCSLSATPFLAAYRRFRAAEAISLGGDLRPRLDLFPGLVFSALPALVGLGFLVTDPVPWHESIYVVATGVALWAALSVTWGSLRSIRTRDTGEPAPRMPGVVRFAWPMVPGGVLLAYALTAPGSSSRGCQDGGTCYEGPISLTLPGFLLLVAGVIAGVKLAQGSSIDKRIRVQLPTGIPRGLDARIERLAELGRLRDRGIIDDAEFQRLKAEVVAQDLQS